MKMHVQTVSLFVCHIKGYVNMKAPLSQSHAETVRQNLGYEMVEHIDLFDACHTYFGRLVYMAA